MNWDHISAHWPRLGSKIKEQWNKLDDDDLSIIDGQYDELVNRVQQRYGVSRQEAEIEVVEWLAILEIRG